MYDKEEATATPEEFMLGLQKEQRIVLTIITTNNTNVIKPILPKA